jgi:hypothetical protein
VAQARINWACILSEPLLQMERWGRGIGLADVFGFFQHHLLYPSAAAHC